MGGGRGGRAREEWNGGLAGEHVRRESAIHTQTRGVCVCVYVSQSKREKTILFHSRGVGDRMAIHSQRHGVCVCMAKGKTILFHRGGGGFSFLPGPHAQLENHKTAGVGEGMPQEAEHKTAAVGEGDAAEAEGYPVPQGGGGENTP